MAGHFGVDALHETSDSRHTGAEDSQVELDIAPDGNGVVVPGNVCNSCPSGQRSESNDTANGDEGSNRERHADCDLLA